jgi:AraC-like DNA-binding protein
MVHAHGAADAEVLCDEVEFDDGAPQGLSGRLRSDAFIFWLHMQGSVAVEPEAQAFAPHVVEADLMSVQGPGMRFDAGVRGRMRSLCVVVPAAVAADAGHGDRASRCDERFTRIPYCDERLRLLMLAIRADMLSSMPAGPLFRDCAARAVVRGFVSLSLGAAPDRDAAREMALSPRLLQRVRDHIEARLSEGLRLDELAASVGLSTSHFCALFKASTGMPPHRYVLHRRVVRARELLRRPDLEVADIATQLGFCDQSQFTKVFRRHAGTTPARYRREVS